MSQEEIDLGIRKMLMRDPGNSLQWPEDVVHTGPDGAITWPVLDQSDYQRIQKAARATLLRRLAMLEPEVEWQPPAGDEVPEPDTGHTIPDDEDD